MNVNKMTFEKKSSLEYYHMTCIGKTKHTSLRGWFNRPKKMHCNSENTAMTQGLHKARAKKINK